MTIKTSRKPPIADINKQKAEANIVCKLNILEAWAKSGIPYVPNSIDVSPTVLEYFPKSIRQFNNWDGSQNSPSQLNGMPAIARNANDTLRAHRSLRERVTVAIDAVITKSMYQIDRAKPLRIKKISQSLALEKKLRIVAETELIVLRENMRQLNRQNNEQRIVLEGTQNEFKKLIQSMDQQLAEAKQEISDLTSRLAKVLPLKKV